MTGEAKIPTTRRDAENSPQRRRDHPQMEQISQIPRDQICVNLRIHRSWLPRVSSQALCVSVVKTCAEQSQFPEDQVNANGCPSKGLGEKDVDYARGKTKPISTRSFKCQVGSLKGASPHFTLQTSNFTLPKNHLPASLRARDQLRKTKPICRGRK